MPRQRSPIGADTQAKGKTAMVGGRGEARMALGRRCLTTSTLAHLGQKLNIWTEGGSSIGGPAGTTTHARREITMRGG